MYMANNYNAPPNIIWAITQSINVYNDFVILSTTVDRPWCQHFDFKLACVRTKFQQKVRPANTGLITTPVPPTVPIDIFSRMDCLNSSSNSYYVTINNSDTYSDSD